MNEEDVPSLTDLSNSYFEEGFEVPNLPEVEENFTDPHIKFSSSLLSEFLKASKPIILSASRDAISRSVSMRVEGPNVRLRVTDFEVTLEYTLPLLNSSNFFTDHIMVPHDSLLKFLRASSPSFVVQKKKKDKFFVRLMGGDVFVETFPGDDSKFAKSDGYLESGNLSVDDFTGSVRSLKTLVSAAMSSNEKKILYSSSGISASNEFILTKMSGRYPHLELRPKDFSVLSALTKGLEEFLISKSPKKSQFSRFAISGKNFTYMVPDSKHEISKVLQMTFPIISTPDICRVDFASFFRVVELSSTLGYATGRLEVNVSKDLSTLEVTMLTRKGVNSKHSIGIIETFGSPVPLRSCINVQSKLLYLALRAHSGEESLGISVTERGLGFSSGPFTSVVFGA